MKPPLKQTFLSTPEDCQWLRDTHLKGKTFPEFNSFILFGNEDSPERIGLFYYKQPMVSDEMTVIEMKGGDAT
jgi:hypothetical protein